MITQQLQAIKARRASVTPGVWKVGRSRLNVISVGSGKVAEMEIRHEQEMISNAAFVAAAPADIDALVAEVERLQQENAELQQQLQAVPTQAITRMYYACDAEDENRVLWQWIEQQRQAAYESE